MLNWESLRRETGISTLTLKKLFSAFEALFLLRPVKRLGKSVADTYYFEDPGIAQYLIGSHSDSISYTDLTHFLFCNLREGYHYNQNTNYSMSSYRKRGEAFIPIIFQAFDHLLAILPALDRQPSLSSLRSAESFLKEYPKAQALILHFGNEARVLHSRLAALPWNWLI